MNHYETKFRVSSKSYNMFGKKTYVGRVRYYENGKYLFSEGSGIHRLTAIDAKMDAYKLAENRLDENGLSLLKHYKNLNLSV